MAFVFHRRLALPVWAVVFVAVALTASPPVTPLLIAVLGLAVIAFTVGGLVPQLRTARSAVHVAPHRQPHNRSAARSMAGGVCVRSFEEPNVRTAPDALDLVRMDDDGGWQMARPPD